MDNRLFINYLKEIYQRISRGDAREESFYSSLEKLILNYGQSLGKKTDVTVLPKKSEAGQPDFRVWDGQSKITGYIEAKSPSTKFLDEIESTEQIKRYLEAYPNVLLTNFFEFRLYRNGTLWDKPVKISDLSLAKGVPQFPVVQNEDKLISLLSYFFDFAQPEITNPKKLAEVLAYKAGIMRDYVVLPKMEENEDNYFSWLYQSFKEHLIKDLKKRDFADLFSQTFVYGLVIAKYDFEAQHALFGKKISDLPFITRTAYDFIQKSFGILREVFRVISTQEMPKELEIIVDDIVDILNHTEIYKILTHSSKSGKKDPIFHLYETFLSKYDKEKKIKLGVFYTPLEVVSYIVNSVHTLLKNGKLFNTPDGLASFKTELIDKSVTLLDPAVGTGTFFVNAIEKAIEEVKIKYSSSSNYISDFIRSHILPHFFAFEILIAPYVVSHLKVLFSLTEKGFEFKNEDWLRIFLTNTLEFYHKETSRGYTGFFERVLVTEQEKALEVKSKTPILVIIGNPPYSVSSQNKVDPKTPFGKFYESYKEKVRKEERNIQPLSDDYIKFLAFAHWKVKQAGKGIVGMITNNSYLDGLIHRDMREKILQDFDLIYILNLHGDVKRPKTTNDGKKDENVFDIRQGVSICLLVKPEKPTKKQIYYQELIGPRENKYQYLNTHNVKTTNWQELKPTKPYWFFVPKDFKLEEKYKNFLSLSEIFKEFRNGLTTGQDKFFVDFNKRALKLRILNVFNFSQFNDNLLATAYRLKSQAGKKLLNSRHSCEYREDLIVPYAYRPFDDRWIYKENKFLWRSVEWLSQQFKIENLAIATTKILAGEHFCHSFVSDKIGDYCYLSNRTKEFSIFFPLYTYDLILRSLIDNKYPDQEVLFDKQGISFNPKAKKSNIQEDVFKLLSSSYNQKITPEDIFYYIYAILYSNTYRQKYEEFLKIDFPKIPFTQDYELFKQLSKLGKELVELHLLKSPLLSSPLSKFEGKDDNFVKKPHYDEKEKRVYINNKQFFTNVLPEVWNYYIGGYQVLFKWLKDRKGKSLKSEEINHYIKVIEAIGKTIKFQNEIDKAYLQIEKLLIKRRKNGR